MSENIAETFRVKYDAEFDKDGDGEPSNFLELEEKLFQEMGMEELDSDCAGNGVGYVTFEDGSVLVVSNFGGILEVFPCKEDMLQVSQSRIDNGDWR